MNKTVGVTIVLVLAIISFFIGYAFNTSSDQESIDSLQTQVRAMQQENLQLKSQVEDLQVSEDVACITHMTIFYDKKQGVISTETGKIAIGFEGDTKEDVTDVISGYGISALSDYETYSIFNVPVGEEINWICKFLNDAQIKNKIKWIEPDALISGGSS